ncbi:MAG: hypothetical protein OEY86_01930 [Nitrospira sp.]|nr:hypothetical protein [Nitrospira sp.]
MRSLHRARNGTVRGNNVFIADRQMFEPCLLAAVRLREKSGDRTISALHRPPAWCARERDEHQDAQG